MRRLTITLIILAPVIVVLPAYIALVNEGTLPPPDFAAIAESVGLGTKTAAQGIFAVIVIVVAFMAATAPILYAIRANDVVTILISFAMTGTAFALFFLSRTALDQIIALIVYLANITLSSAVYAAHKIAPK